MIISDWSFLNGKSKHSHIQVLTTEIPKMTTYYYFYLGLSSKAIFIFTHVFLAAMVSMKFTVFVIITGLLVFIFLRKYLKEAIRLGAGNIQSFRKMLKQIDDFWLTVKMAKVHNSEEFYFKKFEDANAQILEYQYKQLKNRAIPQFLFTIAGIAALIAVVFFFCFSCGPATNGFLVCAYPAFCPYISTIFRSEQRPEYACIQC